MNRLLKHADVVLIFLTAMSLGSDAELAERAVREHEQAMAASAARAQEDRERQEALHQARLADRRASHLQAPPMDLSIAAETPFTQFLDSHASAFDDAITLAAQVCHLRLSMDIYAVTGSRG